MRDNLLSALQKGQEVDAFIVFLFVCMVYKTATGNECQLPNEARLCVIENLAPHQLQT